MSVQIRGLVAVDKPTFYALMGPRDVHPRSEPDRSVWVDQRTHVVLGVSTPGYLVRGSETYMVAGHLLGVN